MASSVFVRFCFIFYFFYSTQALECHNCYSNTGDLQDCQNLSYEELSSKLRWDRISGDGLPPISVTRFAPDACLKFVTEYTDQNGGRQLAVIRTQISTKQSSLFAHDQHLTNDCSLRVDSVRSDRGISTKKSYCACTKDFCNSAKTTTPKLSLFLLPFLVYLLTL